MRIKTGKVANRNPTIKTAHSGRKLQTLADKKRNKETRKIGREVTSAIKHADTTGSVSPLITTVEQGQKYFKVAQTFVGFDYKIQSKIAKKNFLANLKKKNLSQGKLKTISDVLNYTPVGVIHAVNATVVTAKLVKGSIKAIPKIAVKTAVGTAVTVGTLRKLFTGKYQVARRIKTSAVKIAQNIKNYSDKIVNNTPAKLKGSIYKIRQNTINISMQKINAIRALPSKIVTGTVNFSKSLTKLQTYKNAGKAVGGATLKTAVVSGRVLKTSAVVGGKGLIKTAKIGGKVGGMWLNQLSNSLANSQDMTLRTTGQMLKYSKLGTQIAVKGTVATAKTAVGTGKAVVKTVKGVKNIATIYKTQGFKKATATLGKNAIGGAGKFAVKGGKAVVKLVAETAKKAMLKVVLPVVLIVALLFMAGTMMSTPALGAVGYIQESIGWIFKIFHKNTESDYDNLPEPSDDTELYNNYLDLVAQSQLILDNENNKTQKINALKSTYPSTVLNTSNRIDSGWQTYFANLTSKNNDIASREIAINISVLPTPVDGEETKWETEKITYTSSFDWAKITEDFILSDYKSFFIVSYFDKFPDNGTDTSATAVEFKESEVKTFLCKYDGFSGSKEAFPALYDYVEIQITTTTIPRRAEEERTGQHTVSVKKTRRVSYQEYETVTEENPAYAAARERYYDYQTLYDRQTDDRAKSAMYSTLQSYKSAYNNFSPTTITVTKSVTKYRDEDYWVDEIVTETYNIWVTYYSYNIDLIITPRLGKAQLNPQYMTTKYPTSDPKTADIIDRYNFAKEFLQDIEDNATG